MPIRIDTASADFTQRFNAFLTMKREVAADIEAATRAIVDDVAVRGDAALLEATRKFDRLDLKASGLRVTPAEVDAAVAACDAETVEALTFARDRIELFHKRRDRSFILVTHDAPVIKLYCESACVLHRGRLLPFPSVEAAFDFYESTPPLTAWESGIENPS